MLYAKDRGCTKPGCAAPAYHRQAHHVRGWTTTHRTDINDLQPRTNPYHHPERFLRDTDDDEPV